MNRSLSLLFVLALTTVPLGATTFVVPTDAELVAKSEVIVTGVITSARVDDSDPDYIQTLYELQLDGVLKGAIRSGTITIASPGGTGKERFMNVESAAHFNAGDEVLLFLIQHHGHWTPTDMTLGKFHYAKSAAGRALLVRDANDIVGWDRDGNIHKEVSRDRDAFLAFIADSVSRRPVSSNYEVEDEEAVEDAPQRGLRIAANAVFPSHTYSVSMISIQNCTVTRYPARWTTSAMTAGVGFAKNASQNMSNSADGGVGFIQNGTGSWTNDCGSLVNISYTGTTSVAAIGADGTNVVLYNDPNGNIGGSFNGSGVVGTTYSYGGVTHEFDGVQWVNLTSTDIVFQDGVTGAHSFVPAAMTHEIGHALGLRHADRSYLRNYTIGPPPGCSVSSSEVACDPNIQECASVAIMTASANASLGYTLQGYDQNGARALYPGGSCTTCTAPAITTHPQSVTIINPGSTTLSVFATGTATLAYQWYTGTSGNTGSPINGATLSSRLLSPTVTTSYWVRVTNACGFANSNTATVTVNQPSPNSHVRGDYDGDGRADVTVFRPANGWWYWNRSITNAGGIAWGQNGDIPVPADYDGDGRFDVAVFRPSTGWWYYNRSTAGVGGLQWGQNGDQPVPGDYDGDNKDDVGVFRPSNGWWYYNQSTAGPGGKQWGQNGDIAIAGADFEGDGKADVTVFRPSNGWWYWSKSTGVVGGVQWGQNGDQPVVGDFDGDNKDDVAVFRASNGWWYINYTTSGPGGVQWGQNGDIAVPGDFDGDGRTDVAVFRPSNGWWYIRYSGLPVGGIQWGGSGDVPLSH